MMKLLKFFLIFIIATGMLSCNDDDNNSYGSNTVTFKATLNGANERPDPVTTSARGQATLVYDKGTKKFGITVTWTDMDATMGHIHEGGVDVAGPVVFGLFGAPTSSPVYYTSEALTTDEETKLMNNGYYVNLHSDLHQSGEIRGQLLKQTSSGSGGNGGGGGGGPY